MSSLLAAEAAAQLLEQRERPETASAQSAAPKRTKFHAAFGLGPGLFFANSGDSKDTRTFSGGSVSGELFLGSRVTRRFVLGGAYLRDQIFALSSKDELVDGDEPNLSKISFTMNAFGLDTDLYFRENGGPHMKLFVGYGVLDVDGRDTQTNVDDPSGLLFSAGLGYAFPLTGEVSWGVLLRVNYAQFDVNEITSSGKGTDVDAFLPALLLSAAFN